MAATRTQTESEQLVAPFDDYNRELVENVHPPNWANPTPSGRKSTA